MTKLSSLATATALAAAPADGRRVRANPGPGPQGCDKDGSAESRHQGRHEVASANAASLECSKQADAKGLKGKERKKFRRECKKEAAEKAAKSQGFSPSTLPLQGEGHRAHRAAPRIAAIA